MSSSELLAALDHHRAGRLTEAAEGYQAILAADPECADAWHLLGALYMQTGRLELAESHIRRAIQFRPNVPDFQNNLGSVLRLQGRLPEAAASHRQALKYQPDDAGMHYNLGLALKDLRELDAAAACYQRAIELLPDYPDAHNNLGNVRLAQNRVDEAAACYRRAAELNPAHREARFNLASLHLREGREQAAIPMFEALVEADPAHVMTRINLGVALQQVNRFAESRERYREALAINPNAAEAWGNLGTLAQKEGLLAEAQRNYRAAIAADPHFADAENNLLFCLAHDPQVSQRELAAAYGDWGRRHQQPPCAASFANVRSADRPLRVGYVSADLCRHPVARFFTSVVTFHDRQRVEAYCYANVSRPDKITEQFRSVAHHWRNILGLTDDEVCSQVLSDQIDVLVDLSGHTAGQRLSVFARKPAPIQVTWLGSPAGTGLAAIDWRLSDAVIDPPGEEIEGIEPAWRLPDCFCALMPLEKVPDVTPLPALKSGSITFGSFHKLLKLNEAVLDAWCGILHALPGSRLLVLRDTLVGEIRERTEQEFAKRGIGGDKLELRALDGGKSHLAAYHEIDVALDTFPWCGHTTACESLWMGVPMLTLFDEHRASRMVASVNACLQLEDWTATSLDDYVAKAVACGRNLPELAEMRGTLRQRIRTSALCDGRAFTRGLEDAYRAMWRKWLERGEPR